MDREIKFRAWDIDGKCWIPSEDIAVSGDGEILSNDNDGEGYRREVIPIKIMQYTGLKDKNGKEIYEGDIIISVSRNGKKPHAVIFYPELAAYCGDYGLKYPLNVHELTEIKVIGNIYENPELLEGMNENSNLH